MNRIIKTFDLAFQARLAKDWEKIYVVVDLHGTVLLPNYDGLATEYYPQAKEVMQAMSKFEGICLIMWTCSTEEDREKYDEMFKFDGINFDYINENPEVAGKVSWGDFDTKMYANVGLDDKFSFQPEEDWHALLHYFAEKRTLEKGSL